METIIEIVGVSAMKKSAIVVKKYKDERVFQIDSRRMLSKGYEVQTVTSEQPRSGCGRILLIGIFAAIFKPKPVIIVTYRLINKDFTRSKQDTAIYQEPVDDQGISKW